ncbi:hypothetical protein CHS0354_014396 [Potamilus streckersoni]|uniref:Uncharacterized protein n=1 Tax=Potamilus streckersoni TaxID=2493646 RepID=A0AAE0SAT8_9BIVA|nr:hypothetical protein CHS0354_014396 [Potamilus streckersoni]
MGTKRPEVNETKFPGDKSDGVENINGTKSHVKSRNDVNNINVIRIYATTSRDDVENTNGIKTNVTTRRDDDGNIDNIKTNKITGSENAENYNVTKLHATTIRDEDKNIDDITKHVITSRDEDENTDGITKHVVTSRDEDENTDGITKHVVTSRDEDENIDDITKHVITSRDEDENTDDITKDVITSRDENENIDDKTKHIITSRDEDENIDGITKDVITSRDEDENIYDITKHVKTSRDEDENIYDITKDVITSRDEDGNTDGIQNNATASRGFHENIDEMETHVTIYRDVIEHNYSMETHATPSRTCTEHTGGMETHLTCNDGAHNSDDTETRITTNIDGNEYTECMETRVSTKNEGDDTIGSIKIDDTACRNSVIDLGKEFNAIQHCVKHKRCPKYTKIPKTSFGDSVCKDKTKQLFETIGVNNETKVIKYLMFYLNKHYCNEDLNISDEEFISVSLIKRHVRLYYQPNDMNVDNFLSPSLGQLSFKKDNIKDSKKAGNYFPVKTGDMNIKSISLKIDKIKESYFECSVFIELNLRFELFKYIQGSERLQVMHLYEGILKESKIFLLKLYDVQANLEFIQLLGTLGVTKQTKKNKESEEKCIFMRYGEYIYKMALYDFYIKFYGVIGKKWPDAWYDANKKPQNPSDGDIVTYTIPKADKKTESDGNKGLIAYASKDFFKLCLQYFAGKHDLIKLHTRKNSDENTVAEGTLALAMMMAEAIRNHNTVLINSIIIIIKLNKINNIATAEYLRKHPMMFGRTWRNRNKTGFHFEPILETWEREKYWLEQYQNLKESLGEINMDIHSILPTILKNIDVI